MNPERHRPDFPVLSKSWPNGRLIYFDNACTTLKPQSVGDAVAEYYRDFPVCGERSVHRLGREVTDRVDAARERVARFLGVGDPSQVVFTKNATEAINVVAHGMDWKPGDVVLTTDKEHNSNWVPWLHLAKTKKIRVLTVPSRSDGGFDEAAYKARLDEAGDGLRLVSVVHASNADGAVTPLERVTRLAHEKGARVLADAAQSAGHYAVDAARLGVDYLAASVHKMLGPSGLGFLYGTREALEELGPFILGGGTVKRSRGDDYEWQDLPHRFEAGLQNYAAFFGVPPALDYLETVGLGAIEAHERDLNERATKGLAELPHVRIHGPAASRRGGILPFTIDGLDAHDVALYLDEKRNIAVRSGAFCVTSYFAARGLPGWARASFYFYNTTEEVDEFVRTVEALARSVRAVAGTH